MDSGGRTTIATCAALFVLTGFVYGLRLDRVPPYLSHDEVAFSLHAHSIAATGRDVNGRRLPLFFQVNSQLWATPVVVYATAALLKIAPLTETVIRLPSVLVGAVDVVLVYLIGLKVFTGARRALVAAIVLALTPAHVIHSRMAADLIYPVPFLLGSLLAWIAYLERRDLRLLFIAASLQGIGCYSYVGAAIAMPLYFVLFSALMLARDPRRLQAPAVALAGLAWPLAALVVWLLTHPEQFSGQVQMYNVYDPAALTPLQGLRSLLSYASITARVGVYYEFFNPAFLFLSGDASLMNSTRSAGVFLLPLVVLLPVGLNYAINRDQTPVLGVIAGGLLLAPVAALVVAEVKINRALIMLPFAALVAAAGADTMLRARRAIWRLAAVALLAAIPLQFAYFYRDYLTDYPARAAFWFEQNKRAAFENILARDRERPLARIYISRTPRWIDWYWPWYLAKAGRSDLLERTAYILPRELDPAAIPSPSVVFGEVEEIERSPLFLTGARHITRILEPNGVASFIVVER